MYPGGQRSQVAVILQLHLAIESSRLTEKAGIFVSLDRQLEILNKVASGLRITQVELREKRKKERKERGKEKRNTDTLGILFVETLPLGISECRRGNLDAGRRQMAGPI